MQECALPQQNILIDTHDGYVLNINTQNMQFINLVIIGRGWQTTNTQTLRPKN